MKRELLSGLPPWEIPRLQPGEDVKNLERHPDGHLTASIPEDDLRAFARQWPCFGPITEDASINAEFSAAGELVALDGDADLNEHGVLALLNDIRDFGFACVRRMPCRHLARPTLSRIRKYLDDCAYLGIEAVPPSSYTVSN